MAIKLDGHTITELKLKASDGSEVTKQLTEEGTIPTPTDTISITANGTYDVTDKASAVVNVPAPEINLQTKTATTNGDVVADAGYDGLEKVIVNVSGDVPTLISKTISENGTYPASADNADGYSSVTVNIPTPVLPTLTNPASAADILSGKEALDGDGAKLTGTCTFDADTSDANAVASDIAQGKTAYVNGVKITGTASGGSIEYGTEVVEFTTAQKTVPLKLRHHGDVAYSYQYNMSYGLQAVTEIAGLDEIVTIQSNCFNLPNNAILTSMSFPIVETINNSGIVAKTLTSLVLGSIGHAVNYIGNSGLSGNTQAGLTVNCYCKGDRLDALFTPISTGCTNATINMIASEATTYGGQSYAAGETMKTKSP